MPIRLRVVVILAGAVIGLARARAAEPGYISIMPADSEATLREEGFEIWTRQDGLVIGAAADPVIERLSERGVTPVAELVDEGLGVYLLHHPPGFDPPRIEGATVHTLSAETDVYVFREGGQVELPNVKPYAAFQGVPRIPLPPRVTHPADLVAPPAGLLSAFNPLVAQIVAATSQASWFQFVRDLSGDSPVVIGGQTWTISTRYSDAMFPTPRNGAHATEYLEDRGALWGYAGHRETYTPAESGCTTSQSKPWQNLIFVVPGQVDFGQHQQVLFVNHYDSISYSVSESNSFAPGADDAISGGAALLEAMRTFRNYAFKNTIVFAWFSGEEESLCGSTAYVRQHPASDMWRVVNMDQTAFDRNGDRLMDVYNWDVTNSPLSVALGDAFVQASADYGNIIDPAHIVRDGSKMCQTDHCPFWDVGVPAITVIEDLHNHDICPCFDATQNSSCHDTVTQPFGENGEPQFMQDYSWPSEKTSIALVASLAEPLYACPPAPVDPPVVVPGNNAVSISWSGSPGVTRYVVERATSCAGPFTGIASTAGTSYQDVGAVNGISYAYRIRTCPSQVSACASTTPLAGASVAYQTGSAVVTADTGDHDAIADNCELTTVRLNLVNDGNVPLDNVRLASVTSSNPAVRVASALPQPAGSLAPGAAVPVAFKFYLGRDGTSASCSEPLTFTVTATSSQSAPGVRSFTLSAERSPTTGVLSYFFEDGFDGWSTTAGSVVLSSPGHGGPSAVSLHFRTGLSNDCNAVISPVIKPTATSMLYIWVNYILEYGTYDRANVRAVDAATGEKFLLTPGYVSYNVGGHDYLLCDGLGNLDGWSDAAPYWQAASFNLSAYAGREIRIDVHESTDNDSVTGSQGFWMDDVQVTNATQLDCDAQSEVCAALPLEVSPPESPVPLTIGKSGTDLVFRFSESAGAAKYNLYRGSLGNLHHGIYDHAALPGLCGFLDGTVGDGVVDATISASALPDDSYVLAVASSVSGESRYGARSDGADVPLALNACP